VATSNTCIYVSNNYGMSWSKHDTIVNDWNSSFINEEGTLIIVTTLNYGNKYQTFIFLVIFKRSQDTKKKN